MKVFKLPSTAVNLQKCVLPESEFSRRYYGRCCFITLSTGDIYLVKIGLFEIKNIEMSLFFDDSVSRNSYFKNKGPSSAKGYLDNISFGNLTMLKKPTVASRINVIVVFSDVFKTVKFNNRTNDLIELVRNILKLFVMCNNSFLSLTALNNKANFGIELLKIISSDILNPEQPYEINSFTDIKIVECITSLQFDQLHLKKRLPQLEGCNKAFERLVEAVQCSCFLPPNLKQRNKILLVGPRGCGKASLVHNVAANCKCVLLEISVNEINVIGNRERKFYDIFKECQFYCKQGHACIILIRNINLMCGKEASSKTLMHLISFLEDLENLSKVVVIATTNSLDSVDINLRRYKRFDEEIELVIPNIRERKNIIFQLLNQYHISCNTSFLNKLAKWTTGFVGADLKLLVVEALVALHRIQNSNYTNANLLESCFEKAFTKVIPSGLRSVKDLCPTTKISFSQIGGLEAVKRLLDFAVKRQIDHPEKFYKFGVPLTKGILLYGPPGCAKTTLIKALATECHTKLLAVSAAELYSPYVGDAEKNIVRLFDEARINSPAIIFIDEIDALIGNKSNFREHGVQDRILSTLLVEMDGVGVKINSKEKVVEGFRAGVVNDGVIVIGATNRPQALDDALIRPGRFDKLIYIPPPSTAERHLILEKLTAEMPLHESVDLKHLAEITNYYSGADLKNLCRESGLYALNLTNMAGEKIHQHHFEYIIKNFRPSLNENIIYSYELFRCSND